MLFEESTVFNIIGIVLFIIGFISVLPFSFWIAVFSKEKIHD